MVLDGECQIGEWENAMRSLENAYIDGAFLTVTGPEVIDIINPATETQIGTLRLANRDDAKLAIAAARRAQTAMGQRTKAERIDMLMSLQAAILSRSDDIRDATIEEYGGPLARSTWISRYASDCFALAAQTLEDYNFTRQIGAATIRMEPVGVSALIAPWNAAAGTICSKLASAIAAGCTSVIKPSELSGLQTQVVTEALHAAGLPPGIFNMLIGRGNEVGDEIVTNPDVARISFTGSTGTGKAIARAAVDAMKRVTLSLSGKSAAILLDDANFTIAIPMALNGGLQNNGQACTAGTRILVPRARLSEVNEIAVSAMGNLRVGYPSDPATTLGPLASAAQYERIQHFIARGVEQGATLLTGGLGKPDGFERGYFVKPTIFTNVRNDMDIAREEIFGPVLSIIPYADEDEAIRVANESSYGLQAYIFSEQSQRAAHIAGQLEAGNVLINRIAPELLAPFGGVKQSGIGREFGVFGLESFLEPKSIVGE
jgi:aldehyde dehydrogenase (NAD+)